MGVRDGRAYVWLSDSTWAIVGSRVAFDERGRRVAEGTIAAALERRLYAVEITTGSLARVKHLDRIAVQVVPTARPARLRIAYPSGQRANLIVPCASASYVLSAGGAWPESVVAVPYDDAADEEIAIQRGEVDIALFWPGELSLRLRTDQRWSRHLGIRERESIVASWVGATADTGRLLDRIDLTHVNEGLLNSELIPGPPPQYAGTDVRQFPCRVDFAFPGWRVLEATIARDMKPGTQAPIALLWREDWTAGSPPGERTLFRVGCAVVCPASLAPVVTQMGLDALVNGITCRGAR